MARQFTIVAQDTVAGSYYTEYVIDEATDVVDLPIQPICSTGSKATVIADGTVYRLNHQGQWILQPAAGGGGGSISPEDREAIIQAAVNRAVTTIVAGATTEYDTLKEVEDYIDQDKVDTAQMQSDIASAQSQIDNIGDYTDEEIEELFNS